MTGRQVGTPLHLVVLPPPQTAAGAETCAPRMAECPSLPGAAVRLKDEWVSGQQTPNICFKSIAFVCRVVTGFGQDHQCFVSLVPLDMQPHPAYV